MFAHGMQQAHARAVHRGLFKPPVRRQRVDQDNLGRVWTAQHLGQRLCHAARGEILAFRIDEVSRGPNMLDKQLFDLGHFGMAAPRGAGAGDANLYVVELRFQCGGPG